MKKILLLMAIILPFVLTSCGDDKDEPKQNLEQELIGRWVGQTIDRELTLEFKADHTGISSWRKIQNVLQRVSTSGSIPFTWSLKNNILSMSYEVDEDGTIQTDKSEIAIENGILKIKTVEEGILEYHKAQG